MEQEGRTGQQKAGNDMGLRGESKKDILRGGANETKEEKEDR